MADDSRLALIEKALTVPGAVLPRRSPSAGEKPETVNEWVGRAILAILGEADGRQHDSPHGRAQELEEGLRTTVADLRKAANQFAGLAPAGRDWCLFEQKADRAEALLSVPAARQSDPPLAPDDEHAEGSARRRIWAMCPACEVILGGGDVRDEKPCHECGSSETILVVPAPQAASAEHGEDAP